MQPHSHSTTITPSSGTESASVHTLLADAPPALDALLELLRVALEQGVEQIHLEPTGLDWRLRLRHDHGLEERRLDTTDPLPSAFARLAEHGRDHGRAFIARPRGEPQLLDLITTASTRGPCHLLRLQGNALAPPRLDALGLDTARLRTLRAVLAGAHDEARPRVDGNVHTDHRGWHPGSGHPGSGHPASGHPASGHPGGWFMVGSGSTIDGARVVRAVAQELASPDRALLCLESGPHPPLPRVVQIDVAAGLPEPLAPDADAVLLATTPPRDTLVALAARAARNDLLVVGHTVARRPSEVLAHLLALGIPAASLALNLPAVLMRHRVRLLCVHCRVRERLTPLDPGIELSSEGGVLDVAAWLESTFATRYRGGEGCTHCHDSAGSGTRDLSDVVIPDARVRAALLDGEIELALALLDASADLASRLSTLVTKGLVAAEEAARHIVPDRATLDQRV